MSGAAPDRPGRRDSFRKVWPASLGPGHYIFAATLLLRLISLSHLTAAPFLLPSGSDMYFYDEWAKQILHGRWTDHRAFYGLPLYPYTLALIYGLFGTGPFFPGLVQVCLDAATAVLIYKICVSILRDAGPTLARHAAPAAIFAVMAAAGWTFFLPAQAYSIILMPTSASVFIFWFLFWAILKRETTPSRWQGLLLGSIIGLAAMGVATSLVLIPLAVMAVFTKWHLSLHRRFFTASLLIAGVIVGSSPCWIHNFFIARDAVFLSAHGGINLWLGNNPDATGYPRFPGMHAGQSQLFRDSIEIAEAAAGRELKRSEVSNYWSSKARTYIRENRAAWLKLMTRKFANFWNAFEYDDLGVIRNLREHGVIFPGLRFGVVAALGLAGLFFAWRRFPASRWIAAAVFVQMLAILSIFVTERYRLIIVPGLLILSALGVARLWENVVARSFLNVALQLATIGLTTLFVSLPRRDPSLWALDAYNAGRLALELKDLPRAERELQRAHTLVPENAETDFALGNLRFAQGNTKAAQELYEAALQIDPKHKGALNNLGIVALNEHQPATAANYFHRALQIEPRNAKTQYLLAKALLAGGDAVGAAVALQRAIELDGERAEFTALAREIEAARK